MNSDALNKFYKNSLTDKLDSLLSAEVISQADYHLLSEDKLGLTDEVANHMIENRITNYTLPFGLGLNFSINAKDYVVPMVTEEPSIIAAASYAAKIIGSAGGFQASVLKREMTGQVALKDVVNVEEKIAILTDHLPDILTRANASHPSIVKRGGGATSVTVRHLQEEIAGEKIEFLVVYVSVDTKEAMGANIINTMMEGIAPYLEELTGGTSLLRILSNYATDCLATASVTIPAHRLQTMTLSGEEIRNRIIEANRFAQIDPYRAVTHNKGIMNGIDAVVLATGNDTRAVEAGAHAYAARDGHYRSLTTWECNTRGDLVGTLTLPLAVGTVGGSISIHPTAQFSHRLLGDPSAEELGEIIASVGLGQNFSALRALVTEGIQKGHMGLHARSLAISAGATGEEIDQVAAKLKQAHYMNLDTAKSLLKAIQQ